MLNLLVIFIVKRDIPLMCEEERTVINMISLQMQTFFTSAKTKDIQHKTAEPRP